MKPLIFWEVDLSELESTSWQEAHKRQEALLKQKRRLVGNLRCPKEKLGRLFSALDSEKRNDWEQLEGVWWS